MKIGTDSLLLGAWANAPKKGTALDIGTGTGVLSLMLAQRFDTLHVHAIEIQPEAAGQAQENFSCSPWSDRLHCLHSDIKDYYPTKAYDLVISNPPYFANTALSSDLARRSARQESTLELDELFRASYKISTNGASFSLVYPFTQRSSLLKLALENGWFLERSMEVLDQEGMPPVRLLVEFTKNSVPADPPDRMTIRNKDGSYHPQYVALTKDFHTIF